METKARVLQEQDCGSLLIDRNRTPYIVGCVLPLSALRTGEPIVTKLESKIQLRQGLVAIELHVQLDTDSHMHVVVSYATHRDFLLALSESYTLYLLTGAEHPVARRTEGMKTLHQRVYEGGVAVEVTENVRAQIALLDRYYHAIPTAMGESAAAFAW